ncbi:MAG: hypothetical protein KGI52_03480 [Burkholderiales bacterium]|nr:hypothetical protein [Burkholderiales bacterium]
MSSTTEQKHTPGPWVVDEPHQVFASSIGEYVAITQIEDHRPIPSEQVEANACLIAAAPELLDAAENALNTLIACCVSAGGVDDRKAILEAQQMLRAAIAKATGATHD